MTVIFGASGHAKEIEFICRSLKKTATKVDLFIANDKEVVNIKGVEVITEDDFANRIQKVSTKITAYIAVGASRIREKIATRFYSYNNIVFPNLISKLVIMDAGYVSMGAGNILFPYTMFTTEISIGDQNHFNLYTSISHECKIGSYNTFSPSTTIAGNVSIGSHNFFGVGAKVIDNVKIANGVIIGAGAVITKDIVEPGTYVGVPARKIK